MLPGTITVKPPGAAADFPVQLRPGLTAGEVKQLANIPAHYCITLERGAGFVSDEVDLSKILTDGEKVFASHQPDLGM